MVAYTTLFQKQYSKTMVDQFLLTKFAGSSFSTAVAVSHSVEAKRFLF